MMLLNTKSQSLDMVIDKISITEIIKKKPSEYLFLEKRKW